MQENGVERKRDRIFIATDVREYTKVNASVGVSVFDNFIVRVFLCAYLRIFLCA